MHWYGDQAIKAVYEEGDRTVENRLLHRHDEQAFGVEPDSRSWPFDGDGEILRRRPLRVLLTGCRMALFSVPARRCS